MGTDNAIDDFCIATRCCMLTKQTKLCIRSGFDRAAPLNDTTVQITLLDSVSIINNKSDIQRRVRGRTQNGAASHRTGYNMGTTTDKARKQERTVLHEGGIDHAKVPADMIPILAEKWLHYR